jgi:hypothetical protein
MSVRDASASLRQRKIPHPEFCQPCFLRLPSISRTSYIATRLLLLLRVLMIFMNSVCEIGLEDRAAGLNNVVLLPENYISSSSGDICMPCPFDRILTWFDGRSLFAYPSTPTEYQLIVFSSACSCVNKKGSASRPSMFVLGQNPEPNQWS